jgi:hypothetical protein
MVATTFILHATIIAVQVQNVAISISELNINIPFIEINSASALQALLFVFTRGGR